MDKKEFSATKTLETAAQGLTSGTTFATRYEVIEELGRGGMGRVYKAMDKEINEEVAIKLLKPEIASDESTVERFRNELKLSRKIAHKNICKMYHLATEGMTPYITMEYVKGEDLKRFIRNKGKLSLDEVLSIAKQVCEGLVGAHELGVVHRDLKPQNIMIDELGRAKIMDFGIARSLEAPGVTQTGVMIGTPDYISPEQAEGVEADHRADIYALGVILYEMATGTVPFVGDTALSVALKHKSVLPPEPIKLNPEVSTELNKLILSCMEKERERRYQTASELLSDLINIEEGLPLGFRKIPARKKVARKRRVIKWKSLFLYGGVPLLVILLAAGAIYIVKEQAAAIDSIAVLPFENLTGDPTQAYFAEGMTDELIGQLGKIGSLQRVMSRSSVKRYRDSQKPLSEIGQELNVDAVVEGSVQKTGGGSVSIRVRLIKVFPEEQTIWEDTYDRAMTEVMVMQSEIARTIARKVRAELTPEQIARFESTAVVNPETYGAYLKAMSHLGEREYDEAIAYFNEAVQKDPSDAMAYAGMALGYAVIGHDLNPDPDTWPKCRAAADRALRLDDTIAEGHAALGDFKLYLERDWEGAEKAFRRANELNPHLAHNLYNYSWYYALFSQREEAEAAHLRAQEVDPFEIRNTCDMGMLYWMYGEYDKGIAEVEKVLSLHPDNPRILFNAGIVLAGAGRYEEAIAAHKRLYEKNPDNPRWGIKWPLASTYALAGQREDALKIVAEVEGGGNMNLWHAYGLAVVYACLGEKDKTFEWLAYEPSHPWVPWSRVFPWFEFIWEDPRFSDFLEELNLPQLE